MYARKWYLETLFLFPNLHSLKSCQTFFLLITHLCTISQKQSLLSEETTSFIQVFKQCFMGSLKLQTELAQSDILFTLLL